MFLRGLFTKSSLNLMSSYTLEGLAILDKADYIPKFVYEYLYEAAAYHNKQDYVAGVGNYVNYAKVKHFNRDEDEKNEKIRHKEYNFHAGEEVENPTGFTISEFFATGDSSLVAKPIVSWCSKIRSNDSDAIDFRYELEDNIEQFNLARRYLLETYAIDLKRMLYLAIQEGRKSTQKYLQGVFLREQDSNLLEVLVFLIKFVEFEEYLASSEEVLVVGR